MPGLLSRITPHNNQRRPAIAPAFFYAWNLPACFCLRVNAARPCPLPLAETYRGPCSAARGTGSGDRGTCTRTRYRIAAGRRPQAVIRDPRSTGREFRTSNLEHRRAGRDRSTAIGRPGSAHQGRTRDAPGTHQGRRKASRRRTSEPGKLRADGDRPAWNSSLDPRPGSLLISGQNPRKSAKNRQKSTAAGAFAGAG